MAIKKPFKYLSANEALDMAKAAGMEITLATLLNWVQKHKLGFQPGGSHSKWYIYRDKFQEFLDGSDEFSG